MPRLIAILCMLAVSQTAYAEGPFFSVDCFNPVRTAPKIEAAMALAKESSLYSGGSAPAVRNAYRLTVTSAFSDEPALIVRLDVEPEANSRLVSYVFGNAEKPTTSLSHITAHHARTFEKAYVAADFKPVSYPETEIVNGRKIVTVGIRDGHGWVFEALANGEYRCVHRSAHEEGTFRDLVRSLLRFAGKDTDEYR